MRKARVISLILATQISLTAIGSASSQPPALPAQQPNLEQLEANFKKQFAAIEDLFLHGPAKKVFPPDPRRRLIIWQDELAAAFAAAVTTVDEILKLQPPDQAHWRELRETLWLYSQPNTPAENRTVFGSSEVQKKARLLDTPAPIYPDEARAAKASGEVRLEMVLAADGTVKNIFPMKSMSYGLTQAAFDAARLIKFTPAIRKGQPVSQFVILSYEFKNGKGLAPHAPEHAYYF